MSNKIFFESKDGRGIFITLTESLIEEGFSVFRFDFRGHGESKGRSIDVTVAGEVEDLEAAVEQAVTQGYRPWFSSITI